MKQIVVYDRPVELGFLECLQIVFWESGHGVTVFHGCVLPFSFAFGNPIACVLGLGLGSVEKQTQEKTGEYEGNRRCDRNTTPPVCLN